MNKKAIYEYISSKPKKPVHVREIARVLRIDKETAKKALAELVSEGRLIRTRRKTYGLPEKMNLLVGPVQVHNDGYGFVLAEEGDDLYIPPSRMFGAWPMDKVAARRLPQKNKEKPSGEIIRIIERARRKLVGTLEFSRGYAILRPDDKRYSARLLLSPKGLAGLEEGARIVVNVIYPEESGEKEPYGEFAEYLGDGYTPETEIKAVIHNFDLREGFPKQVTEAAAAIKTKIAAATLRARQDFRELNVFTIDGADAKDFDDAIHLSRLPGGGYQVGVHIADVAHYVKEGSLIDEEARARATSVYLPGKVLPMLPEQLSNGVCSLLPGADRLTISVLLDYDSDWELQKYRIVNGVIRSKARFTYAQVEDFLTGGELPEEYRWLQEDIASLYTFTRALKERRLQAGALDFDTREVKVNIDEDGNLHLLPLRQTAARSLIEELMLLANRTVAHHLSEKGIPALFRVHEDPLADRYKNLVEALNRLGYNLPMGQPDKRAMQRVLQSSKGKPEGKAVSLLMLRSMSLARYDSENLGHFGLAFEDYLHFTSPIRRYPDLVVQRVLKEAIKGKIGPRKKKDWLARFPELAQHTSERERAAEKAERDLTKYFQVKWAEEHLGEVFEGTVSGVTNFGLFVAIKNGVEGLLSMSSLDDDYYDFNDASMELTGRHKGKKWRLGDAIKVRIERATPALRQIDFLLEEDTVKQNETGKRAKRANAKSKKPSQARVLSGPPEEKSQNGRPVRLTASKVYFGEWSGEAAQNQDKKAPKSAKRRKKRSS